MAMEMGGNRRANQIFEAKLRDASIKPTSRSDGPERNVFCRAKYVDRKFFDPSVYPAVLKDASRRMEELEKQRSDRQSQHQQQPQKILSNAANLQRSKKLQRLKSESALLSSYADLVNNRSRPMVSLDVNPFDGNSFDELKKKNSTVTAAPVFPVLKEKVSDTDFFMMSPTKSGAADDWFLSGQTKSKLKSLKFDELGHSWHPKAPPKKETSRASSKNETSRDPSSDGVQNEVSKSSGGKSSPNKDMPHRMNRGSVDGGAPSRNDMSSCIRNDENGAAQDPEKSRPMNRRGSMLSRTPSRKYISRPHDDENIAADEPEKSRPVNRRDGTLSRTSSRREMHRNSLSLSRHSSTGSTKSGVSSSQTRRNNSGSGDCLSRSTHDSGASCRRRRSSKDATRVRSDRRQDSQESKTCDNNDRSKRSDGPSSRSSRRSSGENIEGSMVEATKEQKEICRYEDCNDTQVVTESEESNQSDEADQREQRNRRSRTGRQTTSSSSSSGDDSRSRSKSRSGGKSRTLSKARKRGGTTHGRMARSVSNESIDDVIASTSTMATSSAVGTQRENSEEITTKTEPSRPSKSSEGTSLLARRSSGEHRSHRSSRSSSRSGGRRTAKKISTTKTVLSSSVPKERLSSSVRAVRQKSDLPLKTKTEADAESSSTAPSSSKSDMRYRPEEDEHTHNDPSEASDILEDDDDFRMFPMAVGG